MSEPVLTALITGGLALVGVIWQSRKTRRVNSDEHGATAAKLDRIETKVDRTDQKVDDVRDDLIRHQAIHHRKWWQKF